MVPRLNSPLIASKHSQKRGLWHLLNVDTYTTGEEVGEGRIGDKVTTRPLKPVPDKQARIQWPPMWIQGRVCLTVLLTLKYSPPPCHFLRHYPLASIQQQRLTSPCFHLEELQCLSYRGIRRALNETTHLYAYEEGQSHPEFTYLHKFLSCSKPGFQFEPHFRFWWKVCSKLPGWW